MRYQNEIEEIFKISKEFGSTILNKCYVLQAIYQEGIWKNNDLASPSHKLATMSTLFKHRNEIVRFVRDLEKREKNLTWNFSNLSAPEKILWEEIQKAILPDLVDTFTLLETGSRRLMDLKEQVKSILTNSGHCDPADLYPHLDKGNQDQIVILNMILEGIYPNGRENHVVFGSSKNTVKKQILQMSYQTFHLPLRLLKLNPQRMTLWL